MQTFENIHSYRFMTNKVMFVYDTQKAEAPVASTKQAEKQKDEQKTFYKELHDLCKSSRSTLVLKDGNFAFDPVSSNKAQEQEAFLEKLKAPDKVDTYKAWLKAIETEKDSGKIKLDALATKIDEMEKEATATAIDLTEAKDKNETFKSKSLDEQLKQIEVTRDPTDKQTKIGLLLDKYLLEQNPMIGIGFDTNGKPYTFTMKKESDGKITTATESKTTNILKNLNIPAGSIQAFLLGGAGMCGNASMDDFKNKVTTQEKALEIKGTKTSDKKQDVINRLPGTTNPVIKKQLLVLLACYENESHLENAFPLADVTKQPLPTPDKPLTPQENTKLTEQLATAKIAGVDTGTDITKDPKAFAAEFLKNPIGTSINLLNQMHPLAFLATLGLLVAGMFNKEHRKLIVGTIVGMGVLEVSGIGKFLERTMLKPKPAGNVETEPGTPIPWGEYVDKSTGVVTDTWKWIKETFRETTDFIVDKTEEKKENAKISFIMATITKKRGETLLGEMIELREGTGSGSSNNLQNKFGGLFSNLVLDNKDYNDAFDKFIKGKYSKERWNEIKSDPNNMRRKTIIAVMKELYETTDAHKVQPTPETPAKKEPKGVAPVKEKPAVALQPTPKAKAPTSVDKTLATVDL